MRRRRSSWLPEDADFELDWGTTFGGKPLKREAAGTRPVAQRPSAAQPESQAGYSLAWMLRLFGSRATESRPGVGVAAAEGPAQQKGTKGTDENGGDTGARVSANADSSTSEDATTSSTSLTAQLRLAQRRKEQLGLGTLKRLAKIRAMKGVAATNDTGAATRASRKALITADGHHDGGGVARSPLWLRAFDNERGIPYYYHRETFESRWLPPAAAARTPGASLPSRPRTSAEDKGTGNKSTCANPMRPALADAVEV